VGCTYLEQLEDRLITVETIDESLGVGDSLAQDIHDERCAKGG
jgi:hypothetical protein